MNNQDIINEVRRKNDIVDVIGEKIPLEKRGKNYFEYVLFMMILILL